MNGRRAGGLMAVAAVSLHLLGACAVSVGYDGTAYRCDDEPLCPDGFDCVQGVCVTEGQQDAGAPDSTVVDAAPPTIDALSPDATPAIQTLSFGENTDDDVSGVTADTYVEDLLADENFGASVMLRMDGDPLEVSLVRFDVSAIPAGSEVLEARLVVWTRSSDPLQEGSIQVFEMLESWTQGDNNGGVGVANYNQREAATSWTTAGAGPGSRDTVILADFVPDSNDTQWDNALATAPVQSWVDTSVNHGLALATSEGTPRGCEFHSSESGADTRRPRLVVTFRRPSN